MIAFKNKSLPVALNSAGEKPEKVVTRLMPRPCRRDDTGGGGERAVNEVGLRGGCTGGDEEAEFVPTGTGEGVVAGPEGVGCGLGGGGGGGGDGGGGLGGGGAVFPASITALGSLMTGTRCVN